jgi:hypothetical protein
VSAQKVEVHRPGRLPPCARVHPMLTIFVTQDERAGAPQLAALFALLDQVGAAEVHRRTKVRTSWRMLGSAHPRVALHMEISEPADARGALDLTIDAEDYRRAWNEICGGHWVGITTGARLHPHDDGTDADLDEAFASCIPLESTPPPSPSEMGHAARR